MKTQSLNEYKSLNSNELKSLVMEVKESLATGFAISHKRSFCPADLWSIQRHRKTAGSRRHFSLG